MRRWVFILTVLLLVLGLSACSSDDGGDGGNGNGGGDDLRGVRFTQGNAGYLAGAVVATLNLFPGINGAYIALTGAVDSYSFSPGETMPAEGYDLGELGICTTGSMTAKWVDGDDSRTLTAGDRVALSVANCEGEISGTLTLDFTEVAFALTRAGIAYDLTTEEMVDGKLETGSIVAHYQLEVNRIDLPNQGAFIAHQVTDQTDGGSGLVVTQNGETTHDMGCFRLYFAIDLESGDVRLSEPYAVFKLSDYGVLTMESWGLQAFEYPGGGAPVQGATKLRAMSGSTPCSHLRIPGDGVDSNESFLDITVASGSTVTLNGRTESGAQIFLTTTWGDLN